MIVDESAITKALTNATANLTAGPTLRESSLQGGRRRLRRQRIAASAGVCAVVAAIVPAAFALTSNNPTRQTVRVGHGSGSSLYAAPPTPSDCNVANTAASPAAYPQLLMLPTDQNVMSAYTDTHLPGCPPAHVALTLLHTNIGEVTRGIVVTGPDAPSALEDGYGGPGGATYSGTTAHPEIDGQEGVVYYYKRVANVYWTDSDGGQWQLRSRGVSESALDSLLGKLTVNPKTGTATLPNASTKGWTIAPPAPDAARNLIGWFNAQWRPNGCPASRTAHCEISLTIKVAPDRLNQAAAELPGTRRVSVGVNHLPGVLGFGGNYLVWQPRPGVTATLAVSHIDAPDIMAIAATIEPISPNDPRLHRPS